MRRASARKHTAAGRERKTKGNAMTERAGRRRRLKRRVTVEVERGIEPLFPSRKKARRELRNADSTNRSVCPLEVCADGEVARGMDD